MDRFKYEIGGKVYTQGELVLSQEEELADLLAPMFAGGEELTPRSVADMLLREKKLRRALAIVLVPEGSTVADRDLEATAAELMHACTLTQQMEVVRDFFICNAEAAKKFPAMASEVQALKEAPKAR